MKPLWFAYVCSRWPLFGVTAVERDENAKVPLTLRLPEKLRKQLEERAQRAGKSLNSKVIEELEEYGRDRDAVTSAFGSQDIYAICQILAGCGILAQFQSKQAISEDPETLNRAILAMHMTLALMRPSAADDIAGAPGPLSMGIAREIADFIHAYRIDPKPHVGRKWPDWLQDFGVEK